MNLNAFSRHRRRKRTSETQNSLGITRGGRKLLGLIKDGLKPTVAEGQPKGGSSGDKLNCEGLGYQPRELGLSLTVSGHHSRHVSRVTGSELGSKNSRQHGLEQRALEAGQAEAVVITSSTGSADPLWQPRAHRGHRVGGLQQGLSGRLGPSSPLRPQISPCGEASERTGVTMQLFNVLIYTGCDLGEEASGQAAAEPQAHSFPEFTRMQLCCGFGASVARRGSWAMKPLGSQLNLNSCALGTPWF